MYEELSTLLCGIEAILNSRPRLHISDDVLDLRTLTPAVMVTGKELQYLPANPSAPTDDKYSPAVGNSSSQTVGTHAETEWNFLEAMEQGVLVFSAASDEVDFEATKF